jgi:ATP-dependent Clp protease ATP-binding subunit ClpC
VDFRNTVVIMTSNLGSEFLASRGGSVGFVAQGDAGDSFGQHKALRDRVLGRLRESMRPEFLNRIDEIVLFRKLDQAQLRRIVRLMLSRTEGRLRSQGLGLSVSEGAIDWIAERGYDPEYGARPMRRVIQRELEDRIADLFVASDLQPGGHVSVAVDGETLVVEAGQASMPLAA